jgi:hypothetical protein
MSKVESQMAKENPNAQPATSNHPPGGANVENAKIDTQKIEARFEQVRATIPAHAAFP